MESQGEEAMDQPTQAEPDHHSRPAVVIVFTALLLIVAAVCVYMVVRGSLRWPVPVLVAVTCVITAQGGMAFKRVGAPGGHPPARPGSVRRRPRRVVLLGSDNCSNRGLAGHHLRLSAARAAGAFAILVCV